MEVGIAGTDIRLNTVETEKELREKAVRILKEKYHENFVAKPFIIKESNRCISRFDSFFTLHSQAFRKYVQVPI